VAELHLYSFEDADGNEFGTYTTESAVNAQDYARQNHLRVRAHTYEWTDSELVEGWDFTGRPGKET
jgi:GH35 family endo-1,4-beta-xylanase